LKLAQKRNLDLNKINYIINKISRQEALEEKYKDHQLVNYGEKGTRECHIEPDWLLIYWIDDYI